MNDEGSATRRTPQDDLANRQRPPRQRRRLGLQELRARHALLPVHLREPHRLPQRTRAQGRQRRLRLRRLSDADAEFGRAETVDEKGFYILPRELFENVRERAAPRREPERDPRAGLHEHRRLRRRRRQRGRPQGPLRRPRRQQHQARQHGRQAQREAGQAARRHRRPAARRLRRPHDRRCSATPTST